ncbi:MAG: hypothetical protein AVDCRST_MAG19-3193, partial [uncultured Thermomicrobiales bacterium]
WPTRRPRSGSRRPPGACAPWPPTSASVTKPFARLLTARGPWRRED